MFLGNYTGADHGGGSSQHFAQFGLYSVAGTTLDNKPAYMTRYDFDSGLWIAPILLTQGGVVRASEIELRPEKEAAGIPREWLAYSPETLIRRYGPPSRVEFAWAKGIGTFESVYYMTLYFDAADFVAEYQSKLGFRVFPLAVCPLMDQFRFVTLWMAEGPQDQQDGRTPVQTATPMTMDEFAAQMTGDPAKACLELKR